MHRIMKRIRTFYVYILTNRYNTVLYTGVTNNLGRRLSDHRNRVHPRSFTAQYNVHKLVWFETFTSIRAAIAREKQIKAGSRRKKIALVERENSGWRELWPVASARFSVPKQ
jgi:putative endonuclease